MQSPLDGKALSKLSDSPLVYHDEAGGWYFPQGSLHAFVQGLAELSASKEMVLKDLGQFPLPDDQVSLLKKTLADDNCGKQLAVPDLLKKSNIPIFFAQSAGENGSGVAYIPAASLPICRYFSQVWADDVFQQVAPENMDEDDRDALRGFFILNSFVGES